MNDLKAAIPIDVKQLPTPAKFTVISDELARLLGAVQAVCPRDAKVTFDYNGTLHLHIDVRNLEDVARLEVLLPTVCGNIFANFQRGSVDNHPFFHRLMASVDR